VDPANILVPDPSCQLDLRAEALGDLRVAGEVPAQNLQGNELVQFSVVGFVNRAHATLT
jgi:hypothetical protein